MLSNTLTYNTYKVKLQESWSKWIESWPEDWNWFTTFTFPLGRHFIHEEKAIKKLKVFKNKLNIEVFGRNYQKHKDKGVVMVVAKERQKNGQIHFHCLISRIPDKISRVKYWKIANEIMGVSDIQDAKNPGAIATYITKACYALKQGEVEILGPVTREHIEQEHLYDPRKD